MKITIAGGLGSGKSTVAKLLCSKLKLKHYSAGDMMRELAKTKGVTLLELSKTAEEDGGAVDKDIDVMTLTLGKTQDNFVLDARLGFHFIPDSVKVFLDVKPIEAAKRIFAAKREDEKYNTTLADTLQSLKERALSEKKRYKEYYNIDYPPKDRFDLFIDTTKTSAEEVSEYVISYINERKIA